ncbi:MAG: four helix bundle protein [Alphaproteobacteria bacterium]|nr:four helix bundle protein [Alphaproteobacteria bacterium]
MKLENLPIYVDSYSLLIEIFKIVSRFNKEHKYSIGKDLKDDCFKLFEYLHQACYFPAQRIQYLESFIIIVERIKLRLRVCNDINVIAINKLSQLNLLCDSLVKQALLWKKDSSK